MGTDQSLNPMGIWMKTMSIESTLRLEGRFRVYMSSDI